ncbi:la-related protein 7 [Drosophila albomicans]|uniref:La-related protein 7 n=1 Tax=Drosophila albomicans TaxID=7291 RepID=A0A6P8Y7W2_DROAB|nr:la-related protein 7 [Drosophila albomicans]
MAAKTIAADKTGDGQEPQEKSHKADVTAHEHEPVASGDQADVTGTSPGGIKSETGGGRKRKRHLFNSIRTLMEFYFGDANLSKDRFLRRYVEQDPYVPLDIFLTFNKIKTLTQDVQQISRSLSNSQLLELDKSGLKVRRKTALPVQRDVNDKTLYVEALPRTATHDWLKEVFSRYGAVAYVSLPHYPGTRKIKEFAFIEFEKSSAVEKAVKAFAQVQGVLSVEHTDPADLASIRSFQQQQQQKSGADVSDAAAAAGAEITLKRECDKEETHDGAVSAKRVKLEAPQEQSDQAAGLESTDAEMSQQSETDDNPEDAGDDRAGKESGGGGDAKQTQHKRRRKQKKKPLLDKHKPNIEPSAMELKVLPKSSWCSMRNKYLNLQRRIISEAKSKLWRSGGGQQTHLGKSNTALPQLQAQHHHHQQQQQQQQLTEIKGNSVAGSGVVVAANSSSGSVGHEEGEPLSDAGDHHHHHHHHHHHAVAGGGDVPVPAKRRKRNKNAAGGVHKMNMNFYGAGGSETDDTAKLPAKAEERAPLFKYEPGLIVECALHEPCTNVKDFKADMRQYADIKYVDIKEGDQLAHLRMSTPEAADELAHKLSCAEMQLKVLRGQTEQQYWRKIEQDREAKLTKKVRVQQKRGREKFAKLLAKHIKFDDADDDEIAANTTGGPNGGAATSASNNLSADV